MASAVDIMQIGRGPARSFPFKQLYDATPVDRVNIIKAGVPARKAKLLIRELRVDQGIMLQALNLKTATVNKKAANNQVLSTEDGERVVGLAKLVGQIESLVEESGNPAGFDAPAWLSRWLREPLPAIGGSKPIDLLDTMEGQSIVSNALGSIRSGAFA